MSDETLSTRIPGDVRSRVRELVRVQAPNPIGQVEASTRLEDDLHYDSLALIDLAVCIEREFELSAFAETEVVDVELNTVRDIEDLVERLVGAGTA
jgi:acyl carrier protein